MLTLHSFLRMVFQFVKSLLIHVTKKLYRSAAVLTTGMTVVTVIIFTSSAFGGSGKNALAAFAEAPSEQEKILEEPEETELITEAKVQVELTDSRRQGQLVVGDLLTKNLHLKQQILSDTKADIEKVNTEIMIQREEEAEKARIKEEEEKLRAASVIPNSSLTYSKQDYQVFLRIVQAEAGICDDRGKIMVANVILNRVRSGKFPNNITDVVYQQSQFSPVSNGSINRVKVTQQTIDCVNRALSGEDYSQGAMYFMYRGGSRSGAISWFDNHLTYLFQHGNHEFFK